MKKNKAKKASSSKYRVCRGVLWEHEDFRDRGWQRRECAKLGQAVPGNSDQRAAQSTVGARASISGACLAGRHTLSLLLRLCVCVFSLCPPLSCSSDPSQA